MSVLHWANNNGLLVPVVLAVGLAILRGTWVVVRARLEKKYPKLAARGDVWVERIAAGLPDLVRMVFPPPPINKMQHPYRTDQPPTQEPATEVKGSSEDSKTPTTDTGSGIALMCALALGGAVALAACPRLPEQTDCIPGNQRCDGDQPQVCSGSSRWTAIGDISCREVGAVCVHGITAHCRRPDAGVQ